MAVYGRVYEPNVEPIGDGTSSPRIDAFERHAEGGGTVPQELVRLTVEGERTSSGWVAWDFASHFSATGIAAAIHAHRNASYPKRLGDYAASEEGDGRVQCDLLRDIFGSLVIPLTFLPDWRTSTVLALAEQIYESRDFTAMPILADALAEAGCTDEAVLAHCRGPGPHCRGCHVIDACLGKC